MANLGQIVIGIVGIGVSLIVPGGGTFIAALYGLGIGLTVGGILFPATSEMEVNPTASMGLQLQTSQYGIPIKVLYGTRKFAGNLLHYWNFKTIPHIEVQDVGGKGDGSGGTISRTWYTYSVSLAFGLCMGTATVLRAWAGNDEISLSKLTIYDGSQTTADSHLAGFVSRPPVWKNLCYVVLENYDLGTSPYIPNFTFEVSSNILPKFLLAYPSNTTVEGDRSQKFAYSRDGITWNDEQVEILPGTLVTSCAVAIPQTGENAIYMSYSTYLTDDSLHIAKSVDGGKVWNIKVVDTVDIAGDYNSICSPNVNTAYASYTGDQSRYLRFAKTIDGGDNWTTMDIEDMGASNGIKWTAIDTANNGNDIFIVYYDDVNDNLKFAWSNDGGDTWNTKIIDSSGLIGRQPDIHALNENELFVSYGDYSNTNILFAKSIDGGANWTIGKLIYNGGYSEAYTSIYAIDSNNIFIAFVHGTYLGFAKSIDGGANWTSTLLSPSPQPRWEHTSIFAEDVNTIYIAYTSDGGITNVAILKSTDGGDNWGSPVIATDVTVNEITGSSKGFRVVTTPSDALPSDVSKDILTNDLYSLGLDSSYLNLAIFSTTASYCTDNNLRISLLFDKQISVLDALQYILQHHNGFITYMDGKIAHDQLKWETPVGTLDSASNDFIQEKNQFPIQMSKAGARDYNNKILVEYIKRAKDYVSGIATYDDMVDIDKHGLKDTTVKLDGLMVFERASKIATLLVRKSLASPEKLSFKLGVKNIDIEPGKVWNISDSGLELNNLPARILAIREGEDYKIEVEAQEEKNIYDYKSYGDDTSDPTAPPNLTSDPGDVIRPLSIELPALYSGEDCQVAVVYSASGNEAWAGASLYAAYGAGSSYTKAGSRAWGGRTGSVSGVGIDNYTNYIDIYLDTEDTLISATDFDDLITTPQKNLIIINTSQGEKFIRFQEADLLAPKIWRLSGLIYDTVGFPKLNTYGVITSGDDIGFYENLPFILTIPNTDKQRTLYFKVPSFNFKGEEQSLADVNPISEYIDGLDDKPLQVFAVKVNSIYVDDDDEITVASGDIALEWSSRNRFNTGGYNYTRTDTIVDDSDFQDFEIKIYNGANLLRTVIQTSKSFTYTSAMQSSDGGSSPYDFKIKVNTTISTSDEKAIRINAV